MATTTTSTRIFDPDAGTQALLGAQGTAIQNKVAGAGTLGNFLDFEIGSSATPDASLSNDAFDFSKLGLNPDIFNTAQTQQLGSLTSGQLPQAQLDLIQGIFDPQYDRGQQELLRFADELAGRGGLKLSDSPVADPATRAAADLFAQLGGQQAAATLGQFNVNNQRLDNLSRFGNTIHQQGFQNRLSQEGFADAIRNRAIQNRVNLLGQAVPGTGLTQQLLALNSLNRDVTTNAPDRNTLDYLGALGPSFIDFFRPNDAGKSASSVLGDIGSNLFSWLKGL